MNKHFEDTQYYLKRAAETAKEGVSEEVEGVQSRVRELTGRETEPEVPDSRLEELRAELTGVIGRTEGEASEALERARDRLDAYREERSAPEQ